MPITIQEIIASDTISQLVDKTNFNFDQLLLNGGGPQGPPGPMGPTGPVGGRGPKGSTWYEDTSVTNPGCDPNACPPTVLPLAGDYYLQFNGQVWEYNGTIWVATTVSLLGPMGPPGIDGGFGSFFGNPNLFIDRNAVCPTPSGWNNTTNAPEGANTNNEGILTVLIGAVASNIAPVHPSIPLTDYYKLPDSLALQLESPFVSLMVHQKSSTSRGIMFHGGQPSTGPNAGLNPEQYSDVFGNLCNISVQNDDGLTIDVPKVASAPFAGPWTLEQVIGLRVQSPNRGQSYYAGNQIIFSTGNNASAYSPIAHSNFEINVNQGGLGVPANKFAVNVQNEAAQLMNAQFEMGGGVTLINTPPTQLAFNANVQLVGGSINITTSTASAPGANSIKLISGGSILLDAATYATSDIIANAGSGGIIGTSVGGDILLEQNQAGVTKNITLKNWSTPQGSGIKMYAASQIRMEYIGTTGLANPSIKLDYFNALQHTRFVGHSSWAPAGLAGVVYVPGGGTLQQYNDLSGCLTASSSTFRQTGLWNLNDVYPNSTFEAWSAGNNVSIGGPPLNQIKIRIGNESYGTLAPAGPQTYPVTSGYVAWDNTMQLSVENTSANKQYFTASQNKIGVAAPFVYKRTNNLNSNINSAPLNHKPWGWNTTNNTVPAPLTGSHMPTKSQILCPLVEIGVGPLGTYTANNNNTGPGWGGVANGTNYNAENQNTRLNFPEGIYPGQKITLIVKNYNSYFQASVNSSSVTIRYWGSVTVQIPSMRQQRGIGNPWTSWYAHTGGPSYQPDNGSFQKCQLSGWSGADDDGMVIVKKVEMIWDGSQEEIYRRNGNPGTPGVRGALIQWGWRIIQESTQYIETNLANTSGGGPTQIQ